MPHPRLGDVRGLQSRLRFLSFRKGHCVSLCVTEVPLRTGASGLKRAQVVVITTLTRLQPGLFILISSLCMNVMLISQGPGSTATSPFRKCHE